MKDIIDAHIESELGGGVDGHEALLAMGLVKSMFSENDQRGNLSPLKDLRDLVLQAFARACGDEPVSPQALRKWLSTSELAPVLAQYMVLGLVNFEPERAPADQVRANFAGAFGVRFGRGGAPMLEADRLALAAVFNGALRQCVRGGEFELNREQIEGKCLKVAYETAFRSWKGRDYSSAHDSHDMQVLKAHMALEFPWLQPICMGVGNE